jgi:hypothetical protein
MRGREEDDGRGSCLSIPSRESLAVGVAVQFAVCSLQSRHLNHLAAVPLNGHRATETGYS